MSLLLLDSNVLVHAVYTGSPLHEPADRLLTAALRERGRFCISPQNLIEFCAVVTRPRAVEPPMPLDRARALAGHLARSRRLRRIYPKRGTGLRAVREGEALSLRGTAWYDLYLAQTMRDNGVREIVTEDARDFRRIPFVVPRPIDDPGLLR
jgi:predicted nucleic acid-binding protein